MSLLEFAPDGGLSLALMGEVIDFLEQLRALAPGFDNLDIPGPQAELGNFLSRIRGRTSSWDDTDVDKQQPSAHFVLVWPTGGSLFAQLQNRFHDLVDACCTTRVAAGFQTAKSGDG